MKQAIVVIHGIGEQRPMSTLRDFAEAILPDPFTPGIPKFWSKPDPLSELFELRKLVAPSTEKQPPTDLFEFYWAYKSEGTKLRHVLSWVKALLLRWPWNVPKHLRFLWSLSWALLALATIAYFGEPIGFIAGWSANTIIATVLAALFAILQGFIINYIGDAARYLDASPPNISFRREVRAAGIELLKALHKNPKYKRIVVVGHSLGSVIAYDILTHLWPDFQFRNDQRMAHEQPALEEVEVEGNVVESRGEWSAQFPHKQRQLWAEELELCNRWKVTDLITVGSPLAHAQLLLARSRKEFQQRKSERELPTCPPQAEKSRYSFDPERSNPNRQPPDYWVLHHAAQFACTRWTNIYFPAALGVFGDLVGGKLGPVFGHGIKDVPVTSSLWLGLKQYTPLIHTCYWQRIDRLGGTDARPRSLRALVAALDLESAQWLGKS